MERKRPAQSLQPPESASQPQAPRVPPAGEKGVPKAPIEPSRLVYLMPLLLQSILVVLSGAMLLALVFAMVKLGRVANEVSRVASEVITAVKALPKKAEPSSLDLKLPQAWLDKAQVWLDERSPVDEKERTAALRVAADALKSLADRAPRGENKDPLEPRITSLTKEFELLKNRLYSEDALSLFTIGKANRDLLSRIEGLERAVVQDAQSRNSARLQDVLVVAYDTPALPIKPWKSVYKQVFKDRPDRFLKAEHRLGLYVARSGNLLPIFGLSDNLDKVPECWKRFEDLDPPPKGASETPDQLLDFLKAAFGPRQADNPPRRCVLVASLECPVPTNWGALGMRVDALLIIKGPIDKARSGPWSDFCSSQGGVLRILEERDQVGLADELQRLTQPLPRP